MTETLRHEWKFPLNFGEVDLLKRQLPHFMELDSHVIDGKYIIRSLYFDNYNDKAFFEKENGDYQRVKFRIRVYNGDDSFISLEKKIKIDSMTSKVSCRITRQEYEQIVNGDINWMILDNRELIRELYFRMSSEFLRPKTIVEYERIPFIYEPGNVRITLDYNLKTGAYSTDLFSNQLFVPTESPCLVEVKYDAFIPDVLLNILSGCCHGRIAVSKFATCRQITM